MSQHPISSMLPYLFTSSFNCPRWRQRQCGQRYSGSTPLQMGQGASWERQQETTSLLFPRHDLISQKPVVWLRMTTFNKRTEDRAERSSSQQLWQSTIGKSTHGTELLKMSHQSHHFSTRHWTPEKKRHWSVPLCHVRLNDYLRWPCRGSRRAGPARSASAPLRRTFRWSGRVFSATCSRSRWTWKTWAEPTENTWLRDTGRYWCPADYCCYCCHRL